jgi:amino-acid N-acetyltransferase
VFTFRRQGQPLQQRKLAVFFKDNVLERIEADIGRFFVMERDGTSIACAAFNPYPAEATGELACVAVHPEYRNQRRGDKLLSHIESVARRQGLRRLFVLTTQTAHWFRERGFEPARLADLPMAKQALYNYRRNSKVFVKRL